MSDSDSDHDLHPRTRPHGMPPLVPELTEEQIEEATVVEWKRKEAKRYIGTCTLKSGRREINCELGVGVDQAPICACGLG